MFKLFIIIAALGLALGCERPTEPEFTPEVIWTMESVFEITPVDTVDGDWNPLDHLHSGPIVCWICVNAYGQRDHDGDGIAEDAVRDHPQEGASNPPQPPQPISFGTWSGPLSGSTRTWER